MPTIDEVFQYLGIDYPDEVVTANAARALATAERTLRGAVGEDVWTLLPNDERARELVLIYTDDLYTNHGISAKVSNATRLAVQTMELQLCMELRRLRAREVSSV